MRILALETVTDGGSLALWDNGTCRGAAGDPARRHGERLPGEITAWLEKWSTRLSEVDLLAVISGPGSFTGIRVGLATIQGFALAGQKRVIGVSSLEALTASWQRAFDGPRLVAPCLDGHRGEIFYAAFDVGGAPHGMDWTPVIAPAAARPEIAARTLADLSAGQPLVVIGTGALRYKELFGAAGPNITVASSPLTMAEGAAWLASLHPERAGSPHALRPIYLRRPDAEVARERGGLGMVPSDEVSWTIRRASSAADLQAVEALQAASFASPWGAEAFRWELEHTDVARLYVLEDPRRRIFAYCACWIVLDELHINSLAVDEAHRKQGAGRYLLRRLLAEAAEAGAKAATLEVRASNRAALRLYEAEGFRVEGTRRDYYQDPREDALVLWKRGIEETGSPR